MFNPAKIFVSFLALTAITVAKPSALRQSTSNEDEKKSHLIESLDLVALTLRSAPLIDETQVDPFFYPVGRGTCVDVNGEMYFPIRMVSIDAEQCGTTCITKADAYGYPLVGIQVKQGRAYCNCLVEKVDDFFRGSGVVGGVVDKTFRICYRYNGYVSPSCETDIEGVKERNARIVLDLSEIEKEVYPGIEVIQDTQEEVDAGTQLIQDTKKEVDAGTQLIQDTKKEVDAYIKVILDTQKEVDAGTKMIEELISQANTCQLNDGAFKSQ